MSRENVETALASIDAWNRRDQDGWLANAHPEIEWASAIGSTFEGANAVRRGADEMRAFWDDWHTVWNLEIEIVESRDLGDVVVLLGEGRATGIASGAEAARPIGYVMEFEGGLVRRARAFLSHAETLEAVGLAG